MFVENDPGLQNFSLQLNLIMAKKKKRPENESALAVNVNPGLNLNNLVDLLPCYVSIQDRDLQILFVNENFKKDFGDGVGKKCHTAYKSSPDICPNCPVKKNF